MSNGGCYDQGHEGEDGTEVRSGGELHCAVTTVESRRSRLNRKMRVKNEGGKAVHIVKRLDGDNQSSLLIMTVSADL